MTRADQITRDADRTVRSWPTLPAPFRREVEVAVVEPGRGVAMLRLRGVDHPYPTVPDAIDAAVAMGVPLSRVRVERFPDPSPVVLAVSPALTS